MRSSIRATNRRRTIVLSKSLARVSQRNKSNRFSWLEGTCPGASTSLEKVWLVRSENGKKVGKRVVIRFHYSLRFEVTSMLAVTHKFTSLCGTGILHLVDLPPTRRRREMGNFFSLTTASEFDIGCFQREREINHGCLIIEESTLFKRHSNVKCFECI